MGQVARTTWRVRWENFFSNRRSRPREAPSPSATRLRRPAKITVYDEADFRPRGRSLPRWQRIAQVRFWKISRPLRVFHRRVPAAFLILIYLGALGGLSTLLMMLVLPGQPPPVAPVSAAVPAPPLPAKKLTFQPEVSVGKGKRALTLRDGSERSLTEQMADVEFRAGHYEEAEKLYRQLFAKSDAKPFLAYRIYVCSLLRGNHAQAVDLLPRLARVGAKTPAWNYARATQALQDGRKDEAAAFLAEARREYGEQCAEYDATLRVLGLAP
jgi:hypothetical protein